MRSVFKKKPASKKKKGPSKPGAKPWRTGTWIGLIVFVSVWMFIFGILVGRGTVSTEFDFKDSQKELYTLVEEAARETKKKDPADDLTGEMTSDPFVGLKDSSKGKLKQAPRGTEKKPPRDIKTSKPNPPPKKSKQKAKQKSPAPPPPPPPVPAKQKPPPTPKKPVKTAKISYRTLQAASMQNLGEAKRMVTRLQQKGFNAYIASTTTASGQTAKHRVRLGPYKSEKEARTALTRLKQEGIQGIILNSR